MKVVNNRYQTRSEEITKFRSLLWFTKWWFGWALHIKVDFHKSCSLCESCSVQVYDGTKLGVRFQNAFVDPIGTPEETNTIL